MFKLIYKNKLYTIEGYEIENIDVLIETTQNNKITTRFIPNVELQGHGIFMDYKLKKISIIDKFNL